MHDPTFERDPLDRTDMHPDWGSEIPINGELLPKTIELSWPQWYIAAQVGLLRYITSRQKELGQKYGCNAGALDDIEAAAAEYAVSLAMNISWRAGINTFKDADNGHCTQVRATKHGSGCLIVRPDDPDNHRYILVIQESETLFNIVGWMWGSEAKQEKWKKAPNGRPPAYFIPQEELETW